MHYDRLFVCLLLWLFVFSSVNFMHQSELGKADVSFREHATSSSDTGSVRVR